MVSERSRGGRKLVLSSYGVCLCLGFGSDPLLRLPLLPLYTGHWPSFPTGLGGKGYHMVPKGGTGVVTYAAQGLGPRACKATVQAREAAGR